MKMAAGLLALFLASGFSYGQDQTGIIAGLVTSAGTNEALPGVNVLVSTREKVGAATNTEGQYRIGGLQAGGYEIRFSLVGYQTLNLHATVDQTTETILNVKLIERSVPMEEVTVTAHNNGSLDDLRPSVFAIKPTEVKQLAGGAEDLLRSLKSLPGVSNISDVSAQFTVRGSNPENNLILIDGFEVLNPYRLYGFTSMYNPETVSEIRLQTGGFSAEYGDRLASVLAVSSRNGDNTRPLGGKINTSMTNMNIILEGGLPLFDNASYLVSARRTYYDLIAGPMLKSSKVFEGNVALPHFRDIQTRLVVPLNKSNVLQLNVLSSRDGMNLLSSAERETIDSVNATDNSKNTLAGLTYDFTPTDNVVVRTQASYNNNGGTGSMNMSMADPSQYNERLNRHDTSGIRLMSWNSDYVYSYSKKSIAQKLLWQTGNHSVEIGYGIDVLSADITNRIVLDENFLEHLRSRGDSFPASITESMRYNKYNMFFSDAVAFGDLTVKAGLRFDAYPVLKKQIFVSPRLNLMHKLNSVSMLRATYGKYYQSPGMDKQDMTNRLTYTKETLKDLVPEAADHFIVGYETMLNEKWQFTTEGYYKSLSNLIGPDKARVDGSTALQVGSNPRLRESWRITESRYDSVTNLPVNTARGEGYGIELMLKKTRADNDDKFRGWISYGLSFAERTRDGQQSPFRYDQRHTVNVVGNYSFAESWDIGFTFAFRSGRPYAMALGVQPRVVTVQDNGTSYTTVQVDHAGNTVLDVNYEKDRYSGRLHSHHSLHLRVTNYRTWFGLDWSFYLDIQNVYSRKNEEQVNYYIDAEGRLKEKYIYGLPILPSLGLSVSF